MSAKWKQIQRFLGIAADGIPGDQTADAVAAKLGLRWDHPAISSGATVEKSFRSLLVELARKELGVLEQPKNSNRGARVQQYQAATWLDGTGWPWCAAFICWLVREGLMQYKPSKVPVGFKRPETAGAWDFENWASQQRRYGVSRFEATDRRIEPGDILVFTFSHIGIAETAATGTNQASEIATIEGNTDGSGSREGGGVYRQRRKVSQVREVIRIEF